MEILMNITAVVWLLIAIGVGVAIILTCVLSLVDILKT